MIRFLDRLDARKARTLEAGYLPRVVFLCDGESLPDTPHVVNQVDTPATYCEHCGAVMEDQLARLSGYDTETGFPQYRLVRACHEVRFHSLCGWIWTNDLHRHTVQGPTDTRLVLGVALLATAALLLALALPHLGSGNPPPRYPSRIN